MSSYARRGPILTAELADLVVTAAKLAPGAVETAKLAAGAVDTAALGALQITKPKMAANSIGTDKVEDGSLTQAKLAAGAAGRAQLKTSTTSASGTPTAGSLTVIHLNGYALFPCFQGETSPTAVYNIENAPGLSGSADTQRLGLREASGATPGSYDLQWRRIDA